MSEFQFIVSDHPLKEVENPYGEFLSINEAIQKGFELPDILTDVEDLDRDEKILMNVESEEQLDEIEIKHSLYYAVENVEAYSSKPHVVRVALALFRCESRTARRVYNRPLEDGGGSRDLESMGR
ncbi:hypothetical protein [Exiguobacterium sp. SRB7LM]|uniref:hypothetical protein n=1 Tax=Exiguobacterium sp. SRB7LM TaxID=2608401 RepID=UPI0018C37742|nr:hypothetical protein [Exiguobacterium sp. SRB7LM]MBG0917751.1 hypothetical protein [Exiguobacterium sp. SRB7LM]